MDLINEPKQSKIKSDLIQKTNSILSILGEHKLSPDEITNLSIEALQRFNIAMAFRLEDFKSQVAVNPNDEDSLEQFFCIKNTLKRFSIFAKRVFNDDIWDLISDDLLVEVYDVESLIQILANEKFKEINRYTPRELLTHTYHELYYRRNDIEAKIYKDITMAVQTGKTLPMTVPKHIIQEKRKEDPLRFTMEFLHISPLKDFYGCPKEIVVISSVKILKNEAGVYQI